jgi:hypothetical protein
VAAPRPGSCAASSPRALTPRRTSLVRSAIAGRISQPGPRDLPPMTPLIPAGTKWGRAATPLKSPPVTQVGGHIYTRGGASKIPRDARLSGGGRRPAAGGEAVAADVRAFELS